MSIRGEGEPMVQPQIAPENMTDDEKTNRIHELQTEREGLLQTISDLTSQIEGLAGRVTTLESAGNPVADVDTKVQTKTRPIEPELSPYKADTRSERKENQGRRGRIAAFVGGLAVAGGVALAIASFGGNDKDTERASSSRAVAEKTENAKSDSLLGSLFNKIGDLGTVFNKIGDLGTVPSAEAQDSTPTPASAEQKSAREKLQDRIEHADKAKGVAFTVKRADPTHANMKTIVRELVDGENVKKADIKNDAWGSLDNAIASKDVTAPQAYVGVGINVEANKAVAVGTANMFNGKDIDAPSNMTHKEALDSVVRDLTKKSTKASLTTISGTQNHGFDGSRVYEAGTSENIRVLKVTVDGKASYFKIICLNGQDTLVPYTPPKTPPTPPEVTPPTGGGDRETPQPQPKPNKTPQGGGQTGAPQEKVTPKDANDEQRVPGEPGGNPTGVQETVRPVATVDPVGVGQEQQPLPEPLPVQEAPAGPALEGTGPTTAPQEQGQGTGTPAPTTAPVAGS